MSTAITGMLADLEARASAQRTQLEQQLAAAKASGRAEMTPLERRSWDDLKALEQRVEFMRGEAERAHIPANLRDLGGGQGSAAYARHWADQVADKITRVMGRDGESRAVVSGTIDIPSLVEPQVIPIARPVRLLDLFPNRAPVAGNAYEFFVQTVRTNLATAVADNAVKPTSVLTVAPHTDRCRVIAHLSEATLVRLWTDHDELRSWLQSEMIGGVLDALEAQVISGDPTGGNTESMTGLLKTPGTTTVPFNTDAVTTLRSAVTALQVLGEVPNGWALNPADAQVIDLLRWGTAGGLLTEGYSNSTSPELEPSSSNIFGDGSIKRVVTNSIPAGVAVLGDFTKLRVYVREDATLALDASGVLFTKNQFIARAEGRYGIGVLRPSAFAICDLTA